MIFDDAISFPSPTVSESITEFSLGVMSVPLSVLEADINFL